METPEQVVEYLMADLLAILREHHNDTDYERFLLRLEHDLSLNIITALRATAEAARQEALKDAWDVVNALIVFGQLEGNGTDQTAERNGLVLAANAVMRLSHPAPSSPSEPPR